MIREAIIIYMIFLVLRAQHELYYIDDDEPIEISCYDDIVQHIRYSHIGCSCFKELSINFSKAIEELVLIFYNSIQDYFVYTKIFNFMYPIHYKFRNANASPSLYYSTEYGDDYDDDDCYEFD